MPALETLILSKIWGYSVPEGGTEVHIGRIVGYGDTFTSQFIRENEVLFTWLLRNTPNFGMKIRNLEVFLYFKPRDYLSYKMRWQNADDEL